MIITAVIFAISALGSGIADSSAEFIFYRLLGGLGVGAASVLAPAYIAEVAPAALRGRLATLQQMAIVLGLFAAFMSNFTIASYSGGAEANAWLGYCLLALDVLGGNCAGAVISDWGNLNT